MAKKNVVTYENDTWIAVYVLAKKEHFEIRTKADGYPGYKILSHAESSLGTALTYLFYLETTNLSSMLYALISSFESIHPTMPAKALNEAIETVIKTEHLLWYLSPIFAPFILASENLLSKAKDGTSVAVTEIAKQYNIYRDILPAIKRIAEDCFDDLNFTSQNSNSASRLFFDLREMEPENYPALQFRGMTHEVVQSGCDLSWPYNEERTGKIRATLLKDSDYITTDADVLETRDLTDIVHFLISRCLHGEIRMRKCKYCGRYFSVTDNYGAEYCNRLIDGSTKTCREIGSVRLYEQRILVDPIMQAYKRSYKTHNARIRYGYSTKEEFTAWSKEARAMRDKCIAGEITLDEFTAWLDSDKMR